MTHPSRLLSVSTLAAATVILACGSGASSQGTPIAPPPQGTPIAAPVQGTPVASPSQGTPVAAPARGTPVASPHQGTPVAAPATGTPVAAPGGSPAGSTAPVTGANAYGTPTPVAGPSNAGSMSSRDAAILAAHNAHRARHCAPPLRWSTTIAAVAQRYADELAANGCAFRHSSNGYGENLMRFSPAGSRDAAYVENAWYGEVDEYRYDSPGFAMNTGHFTQVVWAGSTELGCGVAVCNGGETWVCNYSPPGNMQGAFPANVRPATCH